MLQRIKEDPAARAIPVPIPDSDGPPADPTHSQQIPLNLCVNARDAMRDQGTLTLGLDQQEIAPATTRAHPLSMPGVDGLTLVRRLRAGGADVPVIAMMGLASTEQVSELRELGVEHLLQKPFGIGELLKQLSVHFGEFESLTAASTKKTTERRES